MKRSVLRAEIGEQPDVLTRLLVREGANVRRIARSLSRQDLRFVLIAARGTSDNAARYAQYALGLTCRLPVALAGPSLVTLYDSPLRLKGALVVGISQSGRSPDVVETIAAAREAGSPTLAIVNDADSPLARAAAEVIPLHAGEERSVAATKTYTAQLLAVALLASSLSSSRRFSEGLGALPDAVADTLGVGRRGPARRRAAGARDAPRRPLARPELPDGPRDRPQAEGARPPRRRGALRAPTSWHGPIALAGPKLPAIVVSPPGTATEADLAALAAELRRRGSPVLLIGPAGRGSLPVPRLPELLSPIVAVVPGQLLAFHAARARGLDPDAPRGLSKVTETR